MDFDRIVNPLMVLFDQDNRINNRPTHITDMIVLTIKSLIPSENYVSTNIDYTRYNEEIKLWKHYRHGENESLMNIFEDFNPHVYWNYKDDSVYQRIMPIILVNNDFSTVKEEVIKNVLFTTGNIETLIEALLLSGILHYQTLDANAMIDRLKEEVINLSQSDFLNKYKKYYRTPIETYRGNFSIDLERSKIQTLNILNLQHSNKFKTLQDCIKTLLDNKEPETIIGKCINAHKKDMNNEQYDFRKYYYQLANYVYKLRKGRIDPKTLKIEKYNLPDIFQLKEGQAFYHSLLNRSKIIRRQETDNNIIVHINTKSGKYTFKKY
ncbi:hypothetical protein K8M07_11950 [Schnuerera sp. xch1]|uniref:hypothetical protein n=1 Tax=Schnuerera sp. xch1 TaxID=2874283 RepID=UPI001CBCF75F|nr:hypothetical protein [Schnuerera sp. xch1]MBZ2175951.1 hypothetical protein [Schnuerera sp. xch1]